MVLHPPATPNSPREADRIRLEQQAVQHHLAGRLQDAIACYSAASALGPLGFDMTMNWSIALHQASRSAEAIGVAEIALVIQPASPQALGHLGDLHASQGDLTRAIGFYQRALAGNPGFVPALRNLAAAFLKTGDRAAAIAALSRLAEVTPADFAVHHTLGAELFKAGKLREAAAHLKAALQIEPRAATALTDLAGVHREAGHFEAALRAADESIHIDPRQPLAHYNRGLALESLERFDDALSAYGSVLKLDPSHIDARWNAALLHLKHGRFEPGWTLYESRKARRGYDRSVPARRKLPPWTGSAPTAANERLLVLSEQGLGDSIQFFRFALLLAEHGRDIVLSVQEPLLEVFRASASFEVISRTEAPDLEKFTNHVDLLSLPGLFGTRSDAIPYADRPYLDADESSVARWRARLGDGSFKVGLVWRGNPANPNDRMRSVALESLLRHLPAGPRYFGLQHNRSELEAAALAKAAITDLSPDLKHFGETAAACLAMNLIVSVDTSVAHLAGALGLPTWVLLTTPTDWRWGTESATQQWYPHVSTLRGRTEDGWPTVLKELADRLQGEFSRWSDRSRS